VNSGGWALAVTAMTSSAVVSVILVLMDGDYMISAT